MRLIWFEDDGQDVLCWVIDDKGVVVAADMQEDIWAGIMVFMTDHDINIKNIKPGDRLVGAFKDKTPMEFTHLVAKVEDWIPKCRKCRFISKDKYFVEGDYPKVRCTLGLWDHQTNVPDAPPVERWLSSGQTVLNRGPVKRFGATCTRGLPKSFPVPKDV